MSAKLAEKLAELAEAYTNLGTLHTELSTLYDVESAKGGKSGNNAPAGKVSGSAGKAAVGSKGAKSAAVDDDDELPPPSSAGKSGGKVTPAKAAGKKAKAVTEDEVRAAAKALIDAKGKDAAVAIVSEYGGGKLADVDEADYAACKAALEAAIEEEETEAADEDDI